MSIPIDIIEKKMEIERERKGEIYYARSSGALRHRFPYAFYRLY